MKLKLAVLCFLFFVSAGICQEKKGKITYDFHLNLQNYVEGYFYKSVLYYNNSESLFVYNSKKIEGKNGFRKKVRYKSGDISGGVFFRTFDEVGNIVYHNRNNNEMVSRELLNSKYPIQVNEESPDFGWKITKETKTIGKYVCLKAVSENFRGRIYTAWFTFDVPVQIGPWKFQGLPGLILEVYDDLGQIHIVAKDIEYPIAEEFIISSPTESESMDVEEFLEESFNLYQKYVENQKALYATGSLTRRIDPLPYRAIEYTNSQQTLLNEVKSIEIED